MVSKKMLRAEKSLRDKELRMSKMCEREGVVMVMELLRVLGW